MAIEEARSGVSYTCFKQAELPVFVVYPEWSTAAGLAPVVIADGVINVPSMRCPGCQDAEERTQRELSEAQEWAQSIRSVIQLVPEPLRQT